MRDGVKQSSTTVSILFDLFHTFFKHKHRSGDWYSYESSPLKELLSRLRMSGESYDQPFDRPRDQLPKGFSLCRHHDPSAGSAPPVGREKPESTCWPMPGRPASNPSFIRQSEPGSFAWIWLHNQLHSLNMNLNMTQDWHVLREHDRQHSAPSMPHRTRNQTKGPRVMPSVQLDTQRWQWGHMLLLRHFNQCPIGTFFSVK